MNKELLTQAIYLMAEAQTLEALHGPSDQAAASFREEAKKKLEQYELEVLAHACNTSVADLEEAIAARNSLDKDEVIQKQADEIADLKAKIDKMSKVAEEVYNEMLKTLN